MSSYLGKYAFAGFAAAEGRGPQNDSDRVGQTCPPAPGLLFRNLNCVTITGYV